ncbi:hypothetical protein, variant [Aphanomyces invadans]|nr:hypothetical protein, variant [Aphanomyces invadans]ETW09127.1 hypothetical protein, variant [Aphanomyces invadans]|eukprot:XP_008862932.1 hypothetical protein, variant [Aphanomyces invadans]
MLLWIIQKLPKVEKEVKDVDTPRLQFRQSMFAALQTWTSLRQPTGVVANRLQRQRTSILPAAWLECSTPARRAYVASKQPLITDSALCPLNKQRSLLELNALSLALDFSRSAVVYTSDHATVTPNLTLSATLQTAFESARRAAQHGTEHSSEPRELIQHNEASFQQARSSAIHIAASTTTVPRTQAFANTAETATPTSLDQHAQELQALEAELIQLRERCAANEVAWHEVQLASEEQRNLNRQIEARSAVKADDLKDLEQDVAIRHQTLDMLTDASTNIAKLQDMCAKSSTHLMKLAEEWETHRLPLVRELEAHAANQVHRIERAHALESETAYFRAEAKALGDTLIQKQEQRQILERKYDAMAKGIHRSMYTARIMDIIKQVHKQKADIQKIVADIRTVHKQINASSEKLKRSEAIAEERLFRAAKDDKLRPDRRQLYIECYRLFTTIRELFDQLIVCVAETGKRENQCRGLEMWISQLTHHVNLANLERIHHDMALVKHENQALMQEIQAIALATP